MRECFCRALAVTLALLGLCAASVRAEVRTYTYGGSGYDILDGIAVSADGRIALTGHTESSDVALADGAQSRQSGWVLCVDAQGNELWSCLTGYGLREELSAPVFHEDGSLTAVLKTSTETMDELELIRFDRAGEIVLRQTIPTFGEELISNWLEKPMNEGYLCWEIYKVSDETFRDYYLIAWDGKRLKTWNEQEAPLYLVESERHAIVKHECAAWLAAIDGEYNETILAKVTDLDEAWWDDDFEALVSLPDGGATVAGNYYSGSDGMFIGYLERWDARGNSVFKKWLSGEMIMAFEKTARGYAAAVTIDTVSFDLESETPEYEGYMIAFFDEAGVETGRMPLGRGTVLKTIMLPDGSIAVLKTFVAPSETDDEDEVNLDMRLVIIPPEDIP